MSPLNPMDLAQIEAHARMLHGHVRHGRWRRHLHRLGEGAVLGAGFAAGVLAVCALAVCVVRALTA